MKVLVDACVASGVVAALRGAGPETESVAAWNADPGDMEVLGRAHAAQQILVTLDKDFGELAVVRRLPHHGVIRLVGFRASQQPEACLEVLRRYAPELLGGALVTAEPGRTRLRPGQR